MQKLYDDSSMSATTQNKRLPICKIRGNTHSTKGARDIAIHKVTKYYVYNQFARIIPAQKTILSYVIQILEK